VSFLLETPRRAATWRSLLFLASAVVMGWVAFGLLLAGWLTCGLLLITPLIVPALIVFRGVLGAYSFGEAALLRELLDADVPPRRLSSGGNGFWGRAKAVVLDPQFWREQLYAGLRLMLGFPIAITLVSLIGSSLWFVFLPIYYRWVDFHIGSWQVDSLQKAVLMIAVGVVGFVLSVNLVRPLAALWKRIAVELLSDRPLGTTTYALRAHFWLTVLTDATLLVVWAATGRGGSFWPVWVLLGTALPLAVHALGVYEKRRLWLHAEVSVALTLFLIGVWAASGGGYFWVGWEMLALTILFVIHWVLAGRGKLEERIDTLETTRAGAVDVQDTELRRIERDLHDGAQARLVALGMNLGMAEQKLDADPEAARDLVAEARLGVEAALRELRDLARGIHPPVLADRGLEAAVSALAHTSAVPVSVTADIPSRPPAAVETAAYFVAAEALTNAAKHAGATRIGVHLARENGVLVVEVTDDGRGGADPSGSGLTGLRHRVEALDGKLTVVSPSGAGTTLRAELPCAS
jgi:signal transduction histidine kinase